MSKEKETQEPTVEEPKVERTKRKVILTEENKRQMREYYKEHSDKIRERAKKYYYDHRIPKTKEEIEAKNERIEKMHRAEIDKLIERLIKKIESFYENYDIHIHNNK